MSATHRSRRSALDEFLPELDVRLDNRNLHVDPRDVQLDSIVTAHPMRPVESKTTSPDILQVRATPDKSRVQWWPMFAAALVGIGASLLAFGAWARFGNF